MGGDKDRKLLVALFVVAIFLIAMTRAYGAYFSGIKYPIFYLYGFFLIDLAAIALLWRLCPLSLKPPEHPKRFITSTALGVLAAFAGLWVLWLTAPDAGGGVRLFLDGVTLNQNAFYVLALVIIGPVFEESVYRGQFYTILRGRYGLATGVLGSTLLFAIMHGLAPVAFAQGVLLALVYEYSRSLWGSIIVHIANNALWYIVFVHLLRK